MEAFKGDALANIASATEILRAFSQASHRVEEHKLGRDT